MARIVLSMAAVVAALLTSACSNLVYSDRPLFVAGDPPALTFRPGLWATPDPGCEFNRFERLEAWPDCANGTYLDAQGRSDRSETPAVIVAGDPLIAQDGPMPAAKGPFRYMYWAFRPSRFDPRGRATEVLVWFVQCGPPEKSRPRGTTPAIDGGMNTTKHPLPGLEMRDDNCLASDAGTVRRAAAASLDWSQPMATRWVRDGES
jgi:hypothetical protein